MEKTKTGSHLKETLIQMAVAVLPRVAEALVTFLEKVLQEKTHAAQMDQAAKANAVATQANAITKQEQSVPAAQPAGYISNGQQAAK